MSDANVWGAYMTDHRDLFDESVRMAERVLAGEILFDEYRAWHAANVEPALDAIRAEFANSEVRAS